MFTRYSVKDALQCVYPFQVCTRCCLITLERQLMKSGLLYFNGLVMPLSRCIYGVNVQCGYDCLIMWRSHRASCYMLIHVCILHCLLSPLVFVDERSPTLICRLNWRKLQVPDTSDCCGCLNSSVC